MYPANFLGLGEALIFFCFFSCIKTRKEDEAAGEAPKEIIPILAPYWMQYAPTRAHPIYFFEENICPIPQPIFRF